MSIGPDQVREVATLAELELAQDDVMRLSQDLERIVAFVEQLPALSGPSESVTVGPSHLRLREDVVAPVPMTRPVADMAPEFVEGFFVVPALDGLHEE